MPETYFSAFYVIILELKNNAVQKVYVMRKLVYTQHGYADILFTYSCLSKASEKILSMCEIMTQNLEALYLILNTNEKK